MGFQVPNFGLPSGQSGNAVILDDQSPSGFWAAEWDSESEAPIPLCDETGAYVPVYVSDGITFWTRVLSDLEVVRAERPHVVYPSMGDHGRSWSNWTVKCPACGQLCPAWKLNEAGASGKVHGEHLGFHVISGFEPRYVEEDRLVGGVWVRYKLHRAWAWQR